MANPFEYFEQGNLLDALKAAVEQVRDDPGSVERRWALITYLCFTGDLERAETHIRFLLENAPDVVGELLMQRNLLTGEAARRQCFESGRLPEFVAGPTAELEETLKALTLLKENSDESQKLLANVNQHSADFTGTCDGILFRGFRDRDDVTALLLEVITVGGQYFWLPLKSIRRILFREIESPQDIIWRKAELTTQDNHQVTGFVPGLYYGTHSSSDDQLRCGRAAEFSEESGIDRGVGGRTFLVGESLVPMSMMTEVVFTSV